MTVLSLQAHNNQIVVYGGPAVGVIPPAVMLAAVVPAAVPVAAAIGAPAAAAQNDSLEPEVQVAINDACVLFAGQFIDGGGFPVYASASDDEHYEQGEVEIVERAWAV